jgi:hypothetical protein
MPQLNYETFKDLSILITFDTSGPFPSSKAAHSVTSMIGDRVLVFCALVVVTVFVCCEGLVHGTTKPPVSPGHVDGRAPGSTRGNESDTRGQDVKTQGHKVNPHNINEMIIVPTRKCPAGQRRDIHNICRHVF